MEYIVIGAAFKIVQMMILKEVIKYYTNYKMKEICINCYKETEITVSLFFAIFTRFIIESKLIFYNERRTKQWVNAKKEKKSRSF